MKKLLLLLPLLFFSTAFAQYITQNAGTDFFFTSYSSCTELDSRPDSAIVYIVGKEACTGYLENPVTGYRVDFNVAPFLITEIKIPAEQVCSDLTMGIQHKAIYLHTEQPVYLYLQNSINNCEGSSIVSTHKIPVEPLTHFTEEAFLIRIEGDPIGGIIAVEDDTEITIWSLLDYSDADTTVRLSKGEIYAFEATEAGESCPVKITSNCKVVLPYLYCVMHDYTNDYFRRKRAFCSNYTQLLGKEYLHFITTSSSSIVLPCWNPYFSFGHFPEIGRAHV